MLVAAANNALTLTRLSGCWLGGPASGAVPSRTARGRSRPVARGKHPLSAVQLSAGVDFRQNGMYLHC